MFDIPPPPFDFEVIQDHADFMMAIEKSSVADTEIELDGRTLPVRQAWIYVRYPDPYYTQPHHETQEERLVKEQWHLGYFSCKEQSSAVAAFLFFDKNGNFINKMADTLTLQDFQPIPKDNIGSLQLQFVCGCR